MANLPLAFAELLAGGILITAGATGDSPAAVMQGNIQTQPFAGADATGGSGAGAGAGSSPATGAGGQVNPFSQAQGVKVGRTDQGVDVSMSPGSKILAFADSQLVGVIPNWYSGQPYYYFKVLSGPNQGKFWYVAEQVRSSLHIGQTVKAGQPVGTYASSGSSIEMGWATGSGNTLAKSTTGYTEGQVTTAGVSFRNFLRSLGV